MTKKLDEAFLSLAEFMEEAADIEGRLGDRTLGSVMTIETVEMNMPVELDLQVDEAGAVAIGAVPPLYYVATSVMPVFHQITVNLELTHAEADDD
jgi:hypothetical protein